VTSTFVLTQGASAAVLQPSSDPAYTWQFLASSGETNKVTATVTVNGALRIRDDGAPLASATPDCQQKSDGSFTCQNPDNSSAHMTLSLGDGNDTLVWNVPADPSNAWGTMAADGGTGDDHVKSTGACWQNCLVHGGPGADRVGGNGELFGDDGSDYLDATMREGAGPAFPPDAFGGKGTDQLNATGSSVPLIIDLGTQTWQNRADSSTPVAPATGFEAVTGSPFADQITGSPAHDGMRGGKGNDTMDGAGGNDALVGGPGSDTVNGGPGDDVLGLIDGAADNGTCGEGADRYKVDKFDTVAADCETRVPR
jgi:Ca2+-binding RTX toxin-like protein